MVLSITFTLSNLIFVTKLTGISMMKRRHRIKQMRDQVASVFERRLCFVQGGVRMAHAGHNIGLLELSENRRIAQLWGDCDDRRIV